jgi:hypothetical protein
MKSILKRLGAVFLTSFAGFVPISQSIAQPNAFTQNAVYSTIAQGGTTKQKAPSQSKLENFINQGVVGEAEAPSASELRAVSKTKGERASQRATKQIGYKEQPYGSNCNKFSRYFGEGCQPWCGDFVSWAFDLNGDKKLPWVNGSAVINILNWGRKHGHIVKTPRRGDIFIMYGSGYSHVGIVRKPLGSGRFTTVEGNTSNAVRSLVRRDTSYIFFVRVP